MLWRPIAAATQNTAGLTEDDVQRVLTVKSAAWAGGTRGSYSSGLLIFHAYCDLRQVPERERCPAHQSLVLAFIAACAGSYSGLALANNLYAIQAWHMLHGQKWDMTQTEVQAALDGAAALAPATSKRKKREPFTTDLISRLAEGLDLDNPLDAAVNACLKVAFWSMARLGELTVRSIKAFDPDIHVKRSDVRTGRDRGNNEVTVIFIPRTKAASEGEGKISTKEN